MSRILEEEGGNVKEERIGLLGDDEETGTKDTVTAAHFQLCGEKTQRFHQLGAQSGLLTLLGGCERKIIIII